MHLTALQPPRLLRRIIRVPAPALLAFGLFAIYWYKICIYHGSCSSRTIWRPGQVQLHPDGQVHPEFEFIEQPRNNVSVNLVMATVRGDDISWTKKIRLPNLNIVQYFADDQNAKYHPPKNKGREATMYLTYFYDFYDDLPDVSIMVHAHESPWHVEDVLDYKMSYTLSHLDLEEVLQRGYLNIRVGWDGGCPDWIDTTKSAEDSQKQEEPHMHKSFLEIFSKPAEDGSGELVPPKVPQILGAPCCSQFALTRDMIRSVSREDYYNYREWLLTTNLTDYISGRIWEHAWQWVYTQKAVDCPVEWKTYCKLYHICFKTPDELREFRELGWEAYNLKGKMDFWNEFRDPQEGQKARQRTKEIERIKAEMKLDALKRGQNPQYRLEVAKDIYTE